ncbi:MAG TPA: gluconate 2-dehydrogenase subunit 3 family protein [Opitutus sp.]|nr:gluconate 2-dehydrogenase subunit 3 family protein [Opitutus sp.]
MTLTRREALTLMATLCGGTVFGANRLLAGVANAIANDSLSSSDRTLLNEIAEAIIPATPDSGGAKAADVATFMGEIVRDFYTDEERSTFVAGIPHLQSLSRANFSGREFASLTPDERHALLLTLEQPNPTPDYYKMLKQLTLWGYFSSEIGAKQALAYLPVPGRFEACVTIDPATTKAWAY